METDWSVQYREKNTKKFIAVKRGLANGDEN